MTQETCLQWPVDGDINYEISFSNFKKFLHYLKQNVFENKFTNKSWNIS